MPYRAIDLTQVKTYPLPNRANRVALGDLIYPGTPLPHFANPELDEVAQSIAAARLKGAPVIWMIGGHVVKCGL